MSHLQEVFPLYKRGLESERLVLRLPSLEEVAHLAQVSRGNILPTKEKGWMGPWTQPSLPEYETRFLQLHMNCLGTWHSKTGV